MGKGSAPSAPDPTETAEAEARVNRITQFTPDGTVRYGTIGADGGFVNGTSTESEPQYAVQVTESPHQQALRGVFEPAALEMAQGIAGNIPGSAPSVSDFSGDQIAQSIYDGQMEYARDDFQKQRDSISSELQARGIPIGSEAYNDRMQEYDRSFNQYAGQAGRDALLAGRGEQERQYRLAEAERGSRMNELFGIAGGNYNAAPVISPGATQPINYSGLVNQNYQQQVSAYNQSQQNRAGAISTIGGLGTALLLACSKELKDDAGAFNIQALDVLGSLPMQRWFYKGETAMHAGPYAEDFHAATGLGTDSAIHASDLFALLAKAIIEQQAQIEALKRHLEGCGDV